MRRRFDLLGRDAADGQVQGISFASVLYKRLAGGSAKLPEPVVGDPANVPFQRLRRPQPAVLPTGLHPKSVGGSRVPGGHVDSVGDVSDRDFILRPTRKQWQKEAPAHLPVQTDRKSTRLNSSHL